MVYCFSIVTCSLMKMGYSYNHGIIQEIQNLGYISLFFKKKSLKNQFKGFFFFFLEANGPLSITK